MGSKHTAGAEDRVGLRHQDTLPLWTEPPNPQANHVAKGVQNPANNSSKEPGAQAALPKW